MIATSLKSGCIDDVREDILYKFLSLSSATTRMERTGLAFMEELLANITSSPSELLLRMLGVGDYIGPVDVAEYILISWKDFNGGLFGLTNRELMIVECISVDHIKIETRDTFVVSTGNEVSSTSEAEVYFSPGTNLLHNFTAHVPEGSDLVDQYYDPRILCDTAVLRCPGDLYPYDSLNHCYNILSTMPQACKSGGVESTGPMEVTNGYFQGDTVACRFLHLSSAALRPAFHCPHMSSASKKCIVENCPSATRAADPVPLTPVFDANVPTWLFWIEVALLCIYFLVPFMTLSWYKWKNSILLSPIDQISLQQREIPRIEVMNIELSWTKAFGGKMVWGADDFALGGCELTALTSPSGTGKSSLIKLLSGFRLPHMKLCMGRITNKPKILMCDQSPDMWPKEMTVQDILLFSCTLLGSDVMQYHDCLEILGINKLLFQRFGTLSGGQQQLVAIASVIVVSPHPTLILLDEPLGSLDERKALVLLRQLKLLSAQYGHAFVLSVHMCSDAVKSEFDRFVALASCDCPTDSSADDNEETEIPFNLTSRCSSIIPPDTLRQSWLSHSIEGGSCIQIDTDNKSDGHNSTGARVDSDKKIHDQPNIINGIKALMILWHGQFGGWPIIEISNLIAAITGGLLVGYGGRAGFVSHDDVDYTPTNESIRSYMYIVSCLLGISMITSFGVVLLFWVREEKLIRNFNSQGVLASSAYIIASSVRLFFFGCIQAIPWLWIISKLLGSDANTAMILVNGILFTTMYAFICSFMCGLLPVVYSPHVLLYFNCIVLVYSGIMFSWKYLHPALRIVHYANPLFLFGNACSYLFIKDLDTGCEGTIGEVLHYSQCASGQRAYELGGYQKIHSLWAQGVALLYILLSCVGMVCIVLKGPVIHKEDKEVDTVG